MLNKGTIFTLNELDPYLKYANIRKSTLYIVVKDVDLDMYKVSRFNDTADMVAQLEDDGLVSRVTPLKLFSGDTATYTLITME